MNVQVTAAALEQLHTDGRRVERGRTPLPLRLDQAARQSGDGSRSSWAFPPAHSQPARTRAGWS